MADQSEAKKSEPSRPAAAASHPAVGTTGRKDPAEAVDQTRRRIVLSCVWGYLGVNFLMFLRYFFPRALFEPNPIVNIGYASDFALGVDQRFLMSNRIWPVKEPGRLFVIFAQCTHLGCTPDWKPAENIFKCPCHGSGYDSEGVNFEGPAPRPMDRCLVTLDATGQIVVNTAIHFIDDPAAGTNQFNDSGSFLVA
jgi:cytochrome b6-f complex iron-sulfur subunit